jgi:thiol-disulfide isomerase/thioredoxin
VPSTQPGEEHRSPARRRLAEQRAAAAQARRAAARRRRLLLTVGLPSTLVVVVVAVLAVVTLATGAGGPKSGEAASAAASSVVAQVASVPANVLDEVGVGTASAKPTTITAPALTSGGKPEVLYIGAEYCPYCAAERWAVAVALSRFGTFTGLGETASSPSDVFPNTATLRFHGASYASDYLSFTGKEIQSNQVVNGKYAPLDTLSSTQQALFDKYDAPPYTTSAGSIPFIDIGGRYLISGASYDAQVLQGKTQAQIAAALSDPNSAIAKAIDGTANLITAAVCQLTNGQPAAVCQSSGVTTATAALGG